MAIYSNPVFRVTYVFLLVVGIADPSWTADTDNDGRLDLLDAPRYDTSAVGDLVMVSQGIEDLDGASELNPGLDKLYLGGNAITGIERGDLTGLNTRYVYFNDNQITNIEAGAFAGLRLRDLNLNNNHFSDLHLEGGVYETLFHLGIDRFDVKRLYLDDAQISAFSYNEVTAETTEITDLSMVGTTFIGEAPETMHILEATSLNKVTIGRDLFDQYPDDFNSFAAINGNVLTIVEDPTADCNESGGLDFADLACIQTLEQRDEILAELSLRPGDLDGNGTVLFADFIAFARNFGVSSATYLQGNLDLDEGVGFADFLILAEHFGSTPSNAVTAGAVAGEPVPEPNAAWLLGVGLLLAWDRLRRC